VHASEEEQIGNQGIDMASGSFDSMLDLLCSPAPISGCSDIALSVFAERAAFGFFFFFL
jgi:hypothetical protein